MGFKMIYWTPMSGSYFLYGSFLEKLGFKKKKTDIFLDGYGQIGEILQGWIWPDWGL